MNEIQQCVHDIMVIASAFGGHDLAEARRRIEILFSDLDKQTGGHFDTAQRLRDQLTLALNSASGPATKRFLSDLIAWLERDHLER